MSRKGENIYKRKDGRYEGRYVTGRQPDGRTKFGYVYGRQYLAVHNTLLKKKAALLENCADGCAGRISTSGWMERWLETEQKSRVKPSSYQTYRSIYQKHIKPHLGSIPIDRVTQSCIQDFLDILASEGLAPETVKGVYRLLASAMRSAHEEGIIRKTPCRKMRLSTGEYMQQRVLNRDEHKRLARVALERQDIPALLGLYTGMRLGEICALKWSDIDWVQKTVSVRRTVQRIAAGEKNGSKTVLSVGSPKSAHSCRTLPLPDFMLALLKTAQQTGVSAYILGCRDKPADPRTIQRRFQKLLSACGIADAHFHTLRHSFATGLMEMGVDVKTVSTLLGHSSTRITLDFYAHSLPDNQRQAVELLVSRAQMM